MGTGTGPANIAVIPKEKLRFDNVHSFGEDTQAYIKETNSLRAVTILARSAREKIYTQGTKEPTRQKV